MGEYNWCQVPWCWVDPSCPSASLAGDFGVYYSEGTCLGAPDCISEDWDSRCPFDDATLGWDTAVMGTCPRQKMEKKCATMSRDQYKRAEAKGITFRKCTASEH